MVKIWISGNYLYIDDNGQLRNCLVSNAEFNKINGEPTVYTIVTNDGTVSFTLSDAVDENDDPFVSENAFETWFEQNTGGTPSSGGGLTDTQLRATPVPVTLGSENITITGSVNVGSTVEITNDTGNAIPISMSGVNYLFSTVNSSTAQLTAGSSFVGTIENITKYPSLSFLAFADQNLTITIDQFIDAAGTKISETQQLSYVAGEKFAFSNPINGNYIRVTVKNEGGSSTTTLQVDTAYGIIDSNDIIKDDFLRGQSAQTATVNNILIPTSGTTALDVSKYRSFACQVVSTGSAGTFIFEGSNDGTNFQAIPVYNQALVVRVPIVTAITASASQIIYEGSCNFKFLRLRIATTITGGSIQASTMFLHSNLNNTIQTVANGTAANLLVTANIGTGSIAAGTNAIGDFGMQYRANATGAASRTHLISAGTTNATVVKASAGRLLGWSITNSSAAWKYVKLHNQATTPTAGSGVVQTIAVPPNGVREFSCEGGIAFTTGISFTTVTGIADADNTGVTASDLAIDILYA